MLANVAAAVAAVAALKQMCLPTTTTPLALCVCAYSVVYSSCVACVHNMHASLSPISPLSFRSFF